MGYIYFIVDKCVPEPVFHENFNLDDIVTPVKVDELVRLLKLSSYNEKEIEFLRMGFTTGFDIGYEGPINRQSVSENIPLKIGSKEELWNKLMKEVKLRRVAGPYKKIPYKNFIQSPIGLVPNDRGLKTRLIFHLSYDFKDDKSVNYYTPKERCSVKYCNLDYAISMCL